ncbi:MAG: hypothetical protein ABI654_03740 [Betaproteobacteria bacterium]
MDAAVKFLLQESAPEAALKLLDEFKAALDRIAVLRVLHSARDIPAALQEDR